MTWNSVEHGVEGILIVHFNGKGQLRNDNALGDHFGFVPHLLRQEINQLNEVRYDFFHQKKKRLGIGTSNYVQLTDHTGHWTKLENHSQLEG